MEKIKSTPVPLLLTEKEKQKLRRQRRAEKTKDLQEKQALGLIEPPKPRLKLSSFMNAIQAQAVADPTQMEKEVRRDMIERRKKHLEHNERRKLTKQERA